MNLAQTEDNSPASYLQQSYGLRTFCVLLAISLLCSFAAAVRLGRSVSDESVMQLGYFAGPTTDSLLHGGGLTTCTERMGTPGNPICFHAGRMPVVSLVLAAAVLLLGDHPSRVVLLKTALLLVPLELAIYLACLGLPRDRARAAISACLLLAPFAVTQFLSDVAGVHVEENYAYSFLALGLAAVLFWADWLRRWPTHRPLMGGVTAVAIALVYLSKSSLVLAAIVLLGGFLWKERSRIGLGAVAMLLATGLGWAIYQHHAAGRYTFGTSMDGINFHKGNSEIFGREYPPKPPHVTLDDFDPELNRNHSFADEWSFNDFHNRAALVYIKAHPRNVADGWLRKLYVIFLSVKKSGSAEEHGKMLLVETAGLVLFRLIFWSSLAVAGVALFRARSTARGDAVTYLLLVGTVAVPYLAGFAYTRHVSILIYPSVLFCCRMLSLRDHRPFQYRQPA